MKQLLTSQIDKAARFLVLTAALCLVVIFTIACYTEADHESINKNNAETIINALYLYKQKHHAFPKNLDALTPDYITQVPKTLDGEEYYYVSSSTDGFILVFEVTSGYGCGYTDKFKQWECSYGD